MICFSFFDNFPISTEKLPFVSHEVKKSVLFYVKQNMKFYAHPHNNQWLLRSSTPTNTDAASPSRGVWMSNMIQFNLVQQLANGSSELSNDFHSRIWIFYWGKTTGKHAALCLLVVENEMLKRKMLLMTFLMFNLQNVRKVDVDRMEVVKLKGNFRALLSLRGFFFEKADMYQGKSLG